MTVICIKPHMLDAVQSSLCLHRQTEIFHRSTSSGRIMINSSAREVLVSNVALCAGGQE